MRRWTLLLVIPLIASCAIGTCNPSFGPLPVAQIGVMLAGRADGLGLECRGLDPERCRSMGLEALPPGFDPEEVDRVVVSCVGQCSPRGGEVRLDVVRGDEATLIANGGYGDFEQSCR